jgi:hypothetical protein
VSHKTKISEKDSNILNVDVDAYEDCGFCKSEKHMPELRIPWKIWAEWKFISEQMGSKEWACVFWTEKGTVTKYRIPKQEVSTCEVEVKEELGGDGLMHSHHTMGAFHSGQDDAHARNLYTYSIVLSGIESVCTKREKLPCGGFGYRDVKILLTDAPVVDMSLIEIKQEYQYQREYIKDDSDWAKKIKARTLAERQEELDREEEALYEDHCAKCKLYNCESCEYFQDRYALQKD